MNRFTVGMILGLVVGVPGGAMIHAQLADYELAVSPAPADSGPNTEAQDAADSFVSTRILCSKGYASVKVSYRDSIDHAAFVRLEVPPEGDNAVPVTCTADGYEVSGAKLSNEQLAQIGKETQSRAYSYLAPKSQGGGIPVYDYPSVVAKVKPLCDSLAKGHQLPSGQYDMIEAAGFDFEDLCKAAEKLPATANN